MSRHQFGSAVTDDLWAALEEESSQQLPVKRVMDGWTRQMVNTS